MAHDNASESIALIRRTIEGSFDFSGRSRRTEVVYYWVVTALINTVVGFAITMALSWTAMLVAKLVLGLLLSIPFFALFARRLHDQNRSGWWAMILPVILGLNIVQSVRFILLKPNAALEPTSATTLWIGLPLAIAYLVLTFIPGIDGDNRFGADPRLG